MKRWVLVLSLVSVRAYAASEFQCGDGKPNIATARCDCPPTTKESTHGDTSRCDAITVAFAACTAGQVRISGECVSCRRGSHFANGKCVLNVKVVKVPRYPERYCLMTPEGESAECFPTPQTCRVAEADYAKKLSHPPRCEKKDEVACFTSADGTEFCNPDLEVCRQEMLLVGSARKNQRECALQNASVGIPRTVPPWTPPNQRYCAMDDTNHLESTTTCTLFRRECEQQVKPHNMIRAARSLAPLACRSVDPVYCFDTNTGESCYSNMDSCLASQRGEESRDVKVSAGCGAQGTAGKARGATPWTPQSRGYCATVDGHERCASFRSECEWSGQPCTEHDPLYCFLEAHGNAVCSSTQDKCIGVEQSHQLGGFMPTSGCTRTETGKPLAKVPVDPLPLDRYFAITRTRNTSLAPWSEGSNAFFSLDECRAAGSKALTQTRAQQAITDAALAGKGVKVKLQFQAGCRHVTAPYCFHWTMQKHDTLVCVETAASCNLQMTSVASSAANPAMAGLTVSACAQQGKPGPIEVYDVPGADQIPVPKGGKRR